MRQVFGRLKYYVAGLIFLLANAMVGVSPLVSQAAAAPAGKAYVCKYVGTPGVDERLQTGDNPIDVSDNAIKETPVVAGSYFNDSQGRSYVLALDTGQPAPDASACPVPQNDVCPNIPGLQLTVPAGYVVDNSGNCVQLPPPPIDLCPNLPGLQMTIPAGDTLVDGNCVQLPPPPIDVCTNIDGLQLSVPKGFKLEDGVCVAQKAYVCKYVGTPGVDERLQTGQNPIDVSVNAIGEDPVVVGSFFNDAQGRSYVLALDTGQPAPDASACPVPQNDVCPNLPGLQTVVPAGYVVNDSGNCVQPPVDLCNNIEGVQATVPEGLVRDEDGSCVPVETGPSNPTLVVTPSTCVPVLASTGSVTVQVTNPGSSSVTYTVTLGLAASKSLTLAGGATGSVTFSGLAAGTYNVEVSGTDDSDVTTTATLTTCAVGGSGGGQVLGTSTTTPAVASHVAELANTGVSAILPSILAFSLALTASGVMLANYKYRKLAARTNISA